MRQAAGFVHHDRHSIAILLIVRLVGYFSLLGDLLKAPQQAHDDPAPLSAKGLIRRRRLVLY